MMVSMLTSFNTKVMFTPSIISLRTACMYQRAGMMDDSICRIFGMFSIGKIIPDKSNVGKISIIPLINMAATCVSVIVEMSSPRLRDTKMNNNETVVSQNKLPANGTSSTKTDSSKMIMRFTMDKTK